ncbi:hypothetical protein ACE01N_11470 [Saccharicrinis sp. FJH2]|uniref:hypothetical protein n=1 Tax=Saccharicrinis sp. FJH65 TaxID=3344659 RepID=UPI0035F385F2
MKKTLLIISLLLLSFGGFAQIGKEFWFACPNTCQRSWGGDENIQLVIVTFDQPATVRIDQPDVEGLVNIDTTKTIAANSSWIFDLAGYKSLVEVIDGQPLPYGLNITSDNNISVYYANTSDNSEVYTLKGKNAKGKFFIVPMQTEFVNSTSYGATEARSSIEILATEDSTEIEVDLKVMTGDPQQTSPVQTMKINLNRGWAYSFKAKDREASAHLYGTTIRSDKLIVVNTTDDYVAPGDLIGDQLIPVDLLGVNYIAVKNQGNNEKVYVFPTENKTDVFVNGVKANTTGFLNMGDNLAVTLVNDATSITSSKPVVLFQITSKSGSSEFGGAVIPSYTCTGSMETVYSPSFDEITLDIITQTECIGSFTINGRSDVLFASNFAPVPGVAGWSFARLRLDTGDDIIKNYNNVLRIKNSKGYFHVGAYDNPNGNSCSYGYFSDFHEVEYHATSSEGFYVLGDTLRLYIPNPEAFTNILWTMPDGSSYTGEELVIPDASEDNAGMYRISATNNDGCIISDPGAVVINIFDPVTSSETMCSGSLLTLSTGGVGPYNWYPEPGVTDTSIVSVSPDTTTKYYVENHKIGQNILVNGNFQEGADDFVSDYTYGGTNSDALVAAGTYTVWRSAREINGDYNRVYDHTSADAVEGRELIAHTTAEPGRAIWSKTLEISSNTLHEFSGYFITADRGSTPAQLQFMINGELVGDVITPPDAEIITQPVHWKLFKAEWNSGYYTLATLSIVTAEGNPEGANVCIDDIEFKPYFAVADTIDVEVIKTPDPYITGDTIICQGTAVLDAGTFADGTLYPSYSWFTTTDDNGIGSDQVLTTAQPGNYIVKASNQMCEAYDTMYVAPGEDILISLDTIAEICADEEAFTIQYELEEGELKSYGLVFDDKAKAAGFSDVDNLPVTGKTVIVALPDDAPPEMYNAWLKVVNNSVCAEEKLIPIEFRVKMQASDLMAQKWNDVLALYNEEFNGGTSYTSFQWFRNGEPIVGATGSYLYLGEGKEFSEEDSYSVVVTTSDGTTFQTCDFNPEQKLINISLPSLVNPSQTISLGELNLTGNGMATFCDINGIVYSQEQVNEYQNTIQAPANKGVYILRIITGGDPPLQHKLIVQ